MEPDTVSPKSSNPLQENMFDVSSHDRTDRRRASVMEQVTSRRGLSFKVAAALADAALDGCRCRCCFTGFRLLQMPVQLSLLSPLSSA